MNQVISSSLISVVLTFGSCASKPPVFSIDPVEEKIKQIIVEQFAVDEAKVTPTASFKDLGSDELDEVEFIMALEEAFLIEIPDEDAEKLLTVKQATDYIRAHTKTSRTGQPQPVR